MKKYLLSALALAAACMSAHVSAQKLTGVTVEPTTAQVGQPVTVAIDLEAGDAAYCGVRFYWGDNDTTDIKIEDKNAIPYRLTHTYKQPGQYRLMAEGKSVTGRMLCTGKNVYANLTVVAPAPVAAAPAASGQCPDGWTLNKASVNKKTGAYTCTARPGTSLPATNAACPGDLSYFENAKKGQLGCRP